MARYRAPAWHARLRRLVATGYFPSELPPPFNTRSFSRNAVGFANQWTAADIRKYWTAPEHYNIPRYGQARRKLSIVNPINQLHVSHLVSENWDDIKDRLERSRITEFRPEIVSTGGGRAVNGVDFDGVARRRSEILARYGRYVKTDITRFYPSVYTHSIAWSILGKSWVKENHNSNRFKTSYANYLDKAISSGQLGQTIGIPIGPDTSRIISELIATEIEEVARGELPDLNERGVRYVDDMLIGLREEESQDFVLSRISSALYEYELELNAEKTILNGVGCPHAPEWTHYVRSFAVSTRADKQRDEIDSFFEHSIYLSDANPRENVLLFSAKRAATFSISTENWDHFVRWLLYCARRSTTCLSFIVEHLSTESRAGRPLPTIEIRDFIVSQLPMQADAGRTSEVAWLLFWARELGLALPADALSRICQLRSGACALITLDLMQRGLISGRLDTAVWRSFADTKGLKSEMWLVAYEATKKGWWPRRRSSSFITEHPFFADLWSSNVEFYDTTRLSRPRVGRSFFEMIRTVSAGHAADPYEF